MKLFDRFEDWTFCEEAQYKGLEIISTKDELPFRTDLSRSLAIIALFDGKYPANTTIVIAPVNNVLVNL